MRPALPVGRPDANPIDRFIDARLADAHELVPKLEGPFDFVFIDADKEWYTNYVKAVIPKLSFEHDAYVWSPEKPALENGFFGKYMKGKDTSAMTTKQKAVGNRPR